MSIVDAFLVTRLIELVRAQRCIYDPRDPQHTNRAVVNSAWKLIATEMNFPETICREKWANLRSNFARELRKARRKLNEEGPSNKPESQWVFYDAMGFLAPFVKSRLSTVFGEYEEAMPAMVKVERDTSSSNWYEYAKSERENSWNDGTNSGPALETEPLCEILTKRPKIEDDEEYLPRPSPGEADDDRLFLLSLLPNMRRLSITDNMSFRLSVQSLLMEKLLARIPVQTQTDDASPCPSSASSPHTL